MDHWHCPAPRAHHAAHWLALGEQVSTLNTQHTICHVHSAPWPMGLRSSAGGGIGLKEGGPACVRRGRVGTLGISACSGLPLLRSDMLLRLRRAALLTVGGQHNTYHHYRWHLYITSTTSDWHASPGLLHGWLSTYSHTASETLLLCTAKLPASRRGDDGLTTGSLSSNNGG